MTPYNERIAHLYPHATEVEGCLVWDDIDIGSTQRQRRCMTHLHVAWVEKPVDPWVPCAGLRKLAEQDA